MEKTRDVYSFPSLLRKKKKNSEKTAREVHFFPEDFVFHEKTRINNDLSVSKFTFLCLAPFFLISCDS